LIWTDALPPAKAVRFLSRVPIKEFDIPALFPASLLRKHFVFFVTEIPAAQRGSPGLLGQSTVSQHERSPQRSAAHSSQKPIHPQTQQRTNRPCLSKCSHPHLRQHTLGRQISSSLFQQGQKALLQHAPAQNTSFLCSSLQPQPRALQQNLSSAQQMSLSRISLASFPGQNTLRRIIFALPWAGDIRVEADN